ncbi:MAG: glycosyltransferase family 2 protein [Muribaculaceae bacterium]|nr:glycosyltransferase family 2 protein [Muribaculaceae bacterium]
MPEVSIIIPAYNASLYLSQAIESVRRQSVTDWEMIIIDDKSSDNTLAIATNYAATDSRIRVISRSVASGSAFIPRMEGIKAASSPLIAPLDADDALPDNYLEELLRIRRESGARIVYPLIHFLTPSANVPSRDPNGPLLGKVMRGRDSVVLTLDVWRVTCNGGIIPRDLYLEAFRRFGENHNDVNSDESLTRWLLFLADSVIFTSVAYLYRENPDSLTHTISIRRLDILKSCAEVIDLVAENYTQDSEEYFLVHRQMYQQMFDCLRLVSDRRFDKKYLAEAFDRIEIARGRLDFNVLKGRISRHLWEAAQWPLPRLLKFVALRHNIKSAGRKAKSLMARPVKFALNRCRALLLERESEKKIVRAVADLKAGVLPADSESLELYTKYYAPAPDHPLVDTRQISMIICPFDGRIIHGGTTDRLRGVLSTYAEARRRGIPFRISWVSPFRLEDYLEPATFDWRISPEEMIFRKEESYPVVIQDLGNNESEAILKAALDGLHGQIHVYSNSDSQIGHYRELYHELFRPTDRLRKAVDLHRRRLGEEYYAFSFRFAKLLGDFFDVAGEVLPEHKRQSFMDRVAAEFRRLSAEIPADSKILLASDSSTFLEYMKDKDPRIYIVEGAVCHVELGGEQSREDAWLKMFVDQQLIMEAEKVWRLTAKGMYPSGFPRFAAEVGGAVFIDHRF